MRRLAFSLALGGMAIALGAQLGGCNAVSDDCSSFASCGEGGEGAGSDADGGASSNGAGAPGNAGKNGNGSGNTSNGGDAGAGADEPSSCDTTQSPRDAGCLVSERFAVFVSPEGDDASDGTQAAPLASLTKAVELAGGAKLVLVCSGVYDEHVNLTAGAHVYGGFDCEDWSVTEAAPLFEPGSAGPALTIDGVQDEVLIERVSFRVGDAEAAGESAVTAIVNAAPRVTLRSVSLEAGAGAPGEDGKLSAFEFPDATTFKGNPEKPATKGGAEKVCACQRGLSSTGGVGGTPSSSGQNGAKGLPNHGGGAGGDPGSGDCGAGGSGKKGTDAPAASPAAGAQTFGAASASGWEPASGTDGEPGEPGQGGGGGASLNASGHGGGGGCGGCGGNGGAAGQGGGASIALLALDAPVRLEASSLLTSDAGQGGNGAAGQAGQKEAGGGGAPVDTQNSCGGGSGGAGGQGAAGGGGAGGISAGIVWRGEAEPSVSEDSSIRLGKPGAKGSGGAAGSNDGVAGVAQELLKLD